MDNTILKFLLGEGSLDGVWFGDIHPTERGMFWWRKHLRQYLEQAQLQQHSVMQVPQFEKLLSARLEELPYTKHLDDGQYNDGQAYGFECGARWAYEKLSSGTTVASGVLGEANTCAGFWCIDKSEPQCEKQCGYCKENEPSA